jgi:lysophospholipase
LSTTRDFLRKDSGHQPSIGAMPRRLLPSLVYSVLLFASTCAVSLAEEKRFQFRSADGIHDLSAVRFPVAHPTGVIVFVVGRSESWLKYAGLFRELNRAGYTVYSYDHRGQGLSPRLFRGNPQIGHVDDFATYAKDLGRFLVEVRRREHEGALSLIGNSMGAAVIVDFLSAHPDSGVGKVVLCSPMFRIRTAPWPEPIARTVLGILHVFGKGASYAPGEGDASPSEPFDHNRVTSSRERWREILSFRSRHPEALTGGASVDWVLRALDRTARLRKAALRLKNETLILEAGRDELVIPFHPASREAVRGPLIVRFPEGRHELLMEREPIRGEALRIILAFLGNR